MGRRAQLKQLHRLGHALEAEVAVADQPQGRLRGRQEGTGGGAEEHLPAQGQRHDAGRRGLGDALDLAGLGAPGDILGGVPEQPHLPGVQPGPGRQRAPQRGRLLPQRGMIVQGIADTVLCRGEQEQEAIRFVDLPTPVQRQQIPGLPVMGGHHRGGLCVSKLCNQLRAIDKIREQKGHRDRQGMFCYRPMLLRCHTPYPLPGKL
jgi:hypothetical protein